MLKNSESLFFLNTEDSVKSLETTRAVELYQDMLLTAIDCYTWSHANQTMCFKANL